MVTMENTDRETFVRETVIKDNFESGIRTRLRVRVEGTIPLPNFTPRNLPQIRGRHIHAENPDRRPIIFNIPR